MKYFMIGIRLSKEEREIIEKAMDVEKRLGDRGGYGAWARRALLREAQRIIENNKEENRGSLP